MRFYFPASIYTFICFLLLLIACSKTPDEERIRQIIDTMSKAVETGKFAEISAYLDDGFRANGEMSAQQVKQMLMMYGMQSHSVSVTIVSSKTTIDPVYRDKAETTLSVITTTGTSIGGLPGDGSARVVKLQWRKDSDWKILKANWQE